MKGGGVIASNWPRGRWGGDISRRKGEGGGDGGGEEKGRCG